MLPNPFNIQRITDILCRVSTNEQKICSLTLCDETSII